MPLEYTREQVPELFNAGLLKYAQVFKIMTARMGGCAPLCRLLSVDYKNQDGTDCSQDIAIGVNRDMADERLVELIRKQYDAQGLAVSAIAELAQGEDGATCRCLYIKPSFLVEDMAEHGVPVPGDLISVMRATGMCPVNMADFAEGVDL